MRFLLFLLISLCALPVFAHAEGNSRPAEPLFKGVELYSWNNPENGEWLFSLLPGTNRNKDLAEIKDPKNVIVGAQKLKCRLGELAVGEQVFWFVTNEKEFCYPPSDIKDEIAKAAQNLQISLYTSTKK